MTTLKVGTIEHPDGGSNSVNIGGTGSLQVPVGTEAQRPGTGVAGMIRYNTDSGEPEYFNGTESAWYRFRSGPAIDVDYLVIAGGGGGGGTSSNIGGGGGGAGGYRTSFGTGNISGALSAVETAFEAELNTEYTITVGAGGANNAGGSSSVFGTITSTGGGAGAFYSDNNGNNGGSGGGGTGTGAGGITSGGTGTANQGFDGGDGRHLSGQYVLGGGGGGAGAAGGDYTNASPVENSVAGVGGDGIASSITGTSVTRAAGGGGGSHSKGSNGDGGSGGGGAGANLSSTAAVSGTANTGSGGGGVGNSSVANAGSGGSGVVILRVPSGTTATFSGGVTFSLSTSVTGFNIYTVTATTTTSETVTFN